MKIITDNRSRDHLKSMYIVYARKGYTIHLEMLYIPDRVPNYYAYAFIAINEHDAMRVVNNNLPDIVISRGIMLTKYNHTRILGGQYNAISFNGL